MNTTTFPAHWAARPDAVAELYARRREPASSFYSITDRRIALEGMAKPRLALDVIAVLAITGPLTKRAWYSPVGMVDYERALRTLAGRNEIRAIVLQIDSPGGTVDGTARLADVVRRVNSVKPVVAFADGCMCSAAYWIGSQASAIVAERHSLVGSIGTVMVHADFSAMLERSGIKVSVLRSENSDRKFEGNSLEPLGKDVRKSLVDQLSVMNASFIKAIQEARPALRGGDAFTGAAWLAESAPAGLIDEIGHIERAIARAGMMVTDLPERARAPAPERPPAKSRASVEAAHLAQPCGLDSQPPTHGGCLVKRRHKSLSGCLRFSAAGAGRPRFSGGRSTCP